MIIRGQKEIVERYWGAKPLIYMYYGTKLVWSSVSSCFGSGMWLNDKAWSNNDAWKN